VRDFHIDGIVPIIPTPFFGDGRPDWESLRGLIDFAHAAGVCAVCLPAYASEFYKLSEDERRDAVARAVEYAAGKVPVIAQVNFATPKWLHRRRRWRRAMAQLQYVRRCHGSSR
jgi:2-keto-3-deoxy-L-arabinonate dehydratase